MHTAPHLVRHKHEGGVPLRDEGGELGLCLRYRSVSSSSVLPSGGILALSRQAQRPLGKEEVGEPEGEAVHKHHPPLEHRRVFAQLLRLLNRRPTFSSIALMLLDTLFEVTVPLLRCREVHRSSADLLT